MYKNRVGREQHNCFWKSPSFTYLANEEIQQKTKWENSKYISYFEFSLFGFPRSQDKRAGISIFFSVLLYPIFIVHTYPNKWQLPVKCQWNALNLFISIKSNWSLRTFIERKCLEESSITPRNTNLGSSLMVVALIWYWNVIITVKYNFQIPSD